MTQGTQAVKPPMRSSAGRPGETAWRLLRALAQPLPPAAGLAALWRLRIDDRSVLHAAAGLAILGAVSAASAGLHPRRRGTLPALLAGGAAWTVSVAGALALVLGWARALPTSVPALERWLEHGARPLALGLAAVAAGGWLLGAATVRLRLRASADPAHWLLGACVLAGPAAVLGTACALGGPWSARIGAALLAAAAGAFWPTWAAGAAADEGTLPARPARARRAAPAASPTGPGASIPAGVRPGVEPPARWWPRRVRAPAPVPARYRLARPAVLPRPHTSVGVERGAAGRAVGRAALAATTSAGGALAYSPRPGSAGGAVPPRPTLPARGRERQAGGSSAPAGPPAPTGPRRRRRRRRLPRWASVAATVAVAWVALEAARRICVAGWRAAVRRPDPGGVLPLTVRVVPPRTAALRLLALYAYAGLCSAPAAVLLLLGPRGAEAWADPARLSPAAQGAVLGLAAACLAACVALALRSLLLHPLELLLPRLRAVPVAVAGAATALAVRFGGLGAGSALTHGVAGALWAGHGHHLALLVALAVLLLPAVQAAFFFGLLQTRLEECLPLWAALALPAAAFALSGPVTGVPMPALPPAFLLGLILGWTRREAGAAGTAAALAAGTAVAMALTLLVR